MSVPIDSANGRNRWLTIANGITALRLAAAPLLACAILEGAHLAALALFVFAILTDMVDGAIARKLGVASKFGRMMDPLADKALVCGSFICFAIIGQPKLFGLPDTTMSIIQWAVAGIIILREAYVTIIRHIAEAKGINFAATVSGKIKMFLQSFAIGTVVIKMAHVQTVAWGYWFTTITFAIMLAVTVFSGLRATRRNV